MYGYVNSTSNATDKRYPEVKKNLSVDIIVLVFHHKLIFC